MWQWFVAEYDVFFEKPHLKISHCEMFPILKGVNANDNACRNAMALEGVVCTPACVLDLHPVKANLRTVHRLGPEVFVATLESLRVQRTMSDSNYALRTTLR